MEGCNAVEFVQHNWRGRSQRGKPGLRASYSRMMEEAHSKNSHTRDSKILSDTSDMSQTILSASSSITSPTAAYYCHTYASTSTRRTDAFRAHPREKLEQVPPLHRRSSPRLSTPPSDRFEYAGTITNAHKTPFLWPAIRDPTRIVAFMRKESGDRCDSDHKHRVILCPWDYAYLR